MAIKALIFDSVEDTVQQILNQETMHTDIVS